MHPFLSDVIARLQAEELRREAALARLGRRATRGSVNDGSLQVNAARSGDDSHQGGGVVTTAIETAGLTKAFGLAEAAAKTVKSYSGGMRRRLDLAASLVGRPQFLYLDEPTTGLDPRSRLDLWDMIRTLVAEGTTVLLTTQYLDEADRLADEIVVVDRGRVIAAGTPQQLKARVGRQVLEASPADPAHLPATEHILAAFADGDDGAHTDGQVVTVTVRDRAALGGAIRRLDEEGIAVDDLSLRRPSLDEVFLAITGRPTEEEPTRDETLEGAGHGRRHA